MSSAVGSTPGYDAAKVEAWIGARVADLSPPFTWRRLEGGHSNLTFLLTDQSGRRAVIRRPPLGELLPKAHDMGREWALISALAGTCVPVAQPIIFCEDPAVTGAHFYLMGFVEGKPLPNLAEVEAHIPLDRREAMAHAFIDTLAALHAIDPDEAGLSALGRKDGYIERQIKAWYGSWTASITGAGFDDPRAHALREWLSANAPAQGPARIVHGDYYLHNCLFSSEGRLTGVLDWEIATLGDPLADLAYALNSFGDPDDPAPPTPPAPTAAAGLPTRSELAARYAAHTGADLSTLDYYFAFNRWKSAMIVHGVYARYLEGKKSAEGIDLGGLKESVFRGLELSELAAAKFIRTRKT